MLCANRPEGFGPYSSISDPYPTQCFFDTILVPLPTWILVVALSLCPLLFRSPLAFLQRMGAPRRRWVRILAQVAYYFFILVILLMESVEVARLLQIGLGVGLIPFVYAGCVVAVLLQATNGLGRLHGWQIANLLFWLVSLCVTAAKAAAVWKFGLTGPLAREDTAYSTVHQITDLAILCAFYALLPVLEIGLVFIKPGVAYRAVATHRPGDETLEK